MPWLSDILQYALTFERAVVTPYIFVITLVPAFFSSYAMAVLVQLPHTNLYRAALLPVVFWTAFRTATSLDFSWNNPGYAFLNQGLALDMFITAMRSVVWALAQRPYTRLLVCKSGNSSTNDHIRNTPTEHGFSVSSAMWNAWDLIVNFRGIGWNGPQWVHIPTSYFQVESRLAFSLLSLCRCILLALIFDTLASAIHSFGPETFGTPKGGSIFDPLLPPLERYMNSTIITLLSGLTAYVMIDMVYQLHAFLFTVLFQQYPWQWPPLFDSPWLSTSLTVFWGRRWHQVLRECFIGIGSKPMERYLGRAGTVIGAFAVSGILHGAGLLAMGGGTDTLSVVVFFLVQGVGVVMEYAWKQATGTRVGGVIGWLWMLFWLLLWGHIITDVWARRGLIGSELYPEAYKPTTLFLNWMSQ